MKYCSPRKPRSIHVRCQHWLGKPYSRLFVVVLFHLFASSLSRSLSCYLASSRLLQLEESFDCCSELRPSSRVSYTLSHLKCQCNSVVDVGGDDKVERFKILKIPKLKRDHRNIV